MKALLSVNILMLMSLVSCGQRAEKKTELLSTFEDRCIEQISSFQSTGNRLDRAGRATAVDAQGAAKYLLRAKWDLKGRNALVSRTSVNHVEFEFFDLAGNPATSVEGIKYQIVMDMGGHAHTTDECPSIGVEQKKIANNRISLKNINFVMSTRQPNAWFFHKLSAKVNGQAAVIQRLSIPHKVQ